MWKRRQKNISATFQKSRELNCYLKSKMTELASVTTASTHSFTQYLKRTCRCLELTSAAAYAEVQLYLNGFKHNTWNTSLQVKKSKAACLKTFLSAKPAEPLYWYSKLVQGNTSGFSFTDSEQTEADFTFKPEQLWSADPAAAALRFTDLTQLHSNKDANTLQEFSWLAELTAQQLICSWIMSIMSPYSVLPFM